jgi:hypothetical protein
MLSHGIVNAIAVTGQLSSIDGVANAIDVQVAKNKGDIKQEIVMLFFSSTSSMCNDYVILTVLP